MSTIRRILMPTTDTSLVANEVPKVKGKVDRTEHRNAVTFWEAQLVFVSSEDTGEVDLRKANV